MYIMHEEVQRTKPWPPVVEPCPNLFALLDTNNKTPSMTTCVSMFPHSVYMKDGQTVFSYPTDKQSTIGCDKARRAGLDWDGC